MIPIQPELTQALVGATGADAHLSTHERLAARLAACMRMGTLSLNALPPLALYIHIPWCIRKCPYCDFNSHEWRASGFAGTEQAGEAALPEADYVQALVADLEAALPFIWGRRIHSVFIGGGTPSLFSPQAIARLISEVRARLPLEPGLEITLEANPGTFERERFKAFRAAGVTRLSIGVQSFSDESLRAIGRVHDGSQARAAVREAADSFDTFNIDLMYALPGQTLDALRADLEVALEFAPPHLSIYHLTIEPNTVFAKFAPVLPEEDLAFDMLDLIVERTARSGLQRYEVSAFARPGHRCAHNLNYWQFGDYLGIGAGAHSKLSFPNRLVRQVRFREPARFMACALEGDAVAQHSEVGRADLPFEFMLNALRLREGFELQRFSERTGLPLSRLESALQQALGKGWVEREEGASGGWIRPTERGFDFLSDLQALFLPAQ
jgi:putative oxygen-independent coproporphyrinogen III oxidase